MHYGSSVFEGIRAYTTPRGPAVFRLKEHVDRLFHSAACYRIPMTVTREQVIEGCREVVRDNDLGAYLDASGRRSDEVTFLYMAR